MWWRLTMQIASLGTMTEAAAPRQMWAVLGERLACLLTLSLSLVGTLAYSIPIVR